MEKGRYWAMTSCCDKKKNIKGAPMPTRPTSAYEPPRITLQAARTDLGSEYMQFIYKRDRVEILYMKSRFARGKLFLTYSDSECLFFTAYPEVQQLYNGMGWNLEELAAWAHLVSEDR